MHTAGQFQARFKTFAAWATVLGALTPVAGVFAQTTDSSAASAVDQQLAEQDQRIKVLERKLELENEAASAAAASTATVKAGPSGFSLSSADGKNVFKLRGTFSLDGRYFKDFDPTFASS